MDPSPATPRQQEPIALSALNDFLFCPRRAALKLIDGLRGTNEHTIIGDLAHEHVDLPGFEQRSGWTLLRALPLFSDSLGLSGRADLVEVRRDDSGNIIAARPVEYKKGPKRRFDNDEAQLCAQAFCLEEMFGLISDDGAIFHAASKQRREVVFDEALRSKTLETISKLQNLVSERRIPEAILKPQCEGCSLHAVCLPESAGLNFSRLFTPRIYAD